jgi:hypothetical protein
MMYWKNSIADGTPVESRQVLISVNGVYYLSTYDNPTRCFVVPLSSRENLVFCPEDVTVYWTDFLQAPPFNP